MGLNSMSYSFSFDIDFYHIYCSAARVKTMSTVTWVKDSEASNCFGCQTAFSLFLRRHHCRMCGGVFCHKCSDKQLVLKPGEAAQRVCNQCFRKAAAKKDVSPSTKLVQTNRLLYETRSVCAACGLIDRRGFKFGNVPAQVSSYYLDC